MRTMPSLGALSAFVASILFVPPPASALYLKNNVALWPDGMVPVCWDSDSNPEGADEKAIRDGVENQWARAANVSFTGWGRCPARTAADMPDGPPIVFLTRTLADSGLPDCRGSSAGCAYLGTNGNRPTGVYIPPNAKFICDMAPGGYTRTQCIVWEAVHEFGHVLGFAHEHDRFDNPPCFWDQFWPHNRGGGTALTQWDGASVMHYCSAGAGTNQGRLSHRDVAGLQTVYGLKPDGSFVARGGRCLDVHNTDLQAGNPVQLWHCWGGTNQRWEYDAVERNAALRDEPFPLP